MFFLLASLTSPATEPTRLTLVDARLSSVHHPESWFGASRCVDGDPTTACATQEEDCMLRYGGRTCPFLSARFAAGQLVDAIDVFNADDPTSQSWLSPFEVWLGEAPHALDITADSPSSFRCVEPLSGNSTIRVPPGIGPFRVNCAMAGDVRGKTYITLRLVPSHDEYRQHRVLSVGDLVAYATPSCQGYRLGGYRLVT